MASISSSKLGSGIVESFPDCPIAQHERA